MAAFTWTQTDKVIGTLTSGMKVVSTTITFTNVETDAGTIYVKPLQRIISILPAGQKTKNVAGIASWVKHATLLNALTVTPAVSNTGNVWEVISFGY